MSVYYKRVSGFSRTDHSRATMHNRRIAAHELMGLGASPYETRRVTSLSGVGALPSVLTAPVTMPRWALALLLVGTGTLGAFIHSKRGY